MTLKNISLYQTYIHTMKVTVVRRLYKVEIMKISTQSKKTYNYDFIGVELTYLKKNKI